MKCRTLYPLVPTFALAASLPLQALAEGFVDDILNSYL